MHAVRIAGTRRDTTSADEVVDANNGLARTTESGRCSTVAKKIALLAANSDSAADGIRDYTTQLFLALDERPDVEAKLFTRDQRAFATRFEASEHDGWDCASADTAIVQYNPFWYGRWGFAPGLIATAMGLRRAASHPTFALMVHENYIDPSNWKWAAMSAWQRAQLRMLQRLCDVQFSSIEAYAEDLRSAAPHVPTYHLPVGSNFPDHRSARAGEREKLSITDQDIVLCAFGMHHCGRMADQMLAAAHEVGREHRNVVLLNMGTGERAQDELDEGVRLISPGFLAADRAAEMISAADIFLAAFEDGVSTRRTTLMSALQHQVAVVGTCGHLTDMLLRDERDAMHLTPVDEPRRFVEAVAVVARNPELRRRLALRGRRLYERCFDWPVVADSLVRALAEL